MSDLSPALDPATPGFWATFRDPDREDRYRTAHVAEDRFTLRALAIVCVAATLAFVQTDLEQASVWMPRLLASRAIAVFFSLALLVWLRRPRPIALVDRVVLVWVVWLSLWFSYLQAYRPANNLGPLVTTLTSLVITFTILPLPLRWLTAVGSLQAVSCLVVAVWINPVSDPATLRSLVVWLMVTTIMGIVAGQQLQQRSRLLFLAAERQAELTASLEKALAEVKTLRGLIRICAWCKGIHADGEWQQLEQYMSANSDAEFSHGICPTCLAEQIKPQDRVFPGYGK